MGQALVEHLVLEELATGQALGDLLKLARAQVLALVEHLVLEELVMGRPMAVHLELVRAQVMALEGRQALALQLLVESRLPLLLQQLERPRNPSFHGLESSHPYHS